MFRYPLSRCRTGMFGSVIVLLIGSVCCAYTPSCEDISTTDITAIKSWSSCTRVDETDGSTPGCYSGKQQRLVEFASNSSSGVSGRKRQMQCLEYRRCLVPRRRCEGIWSIWKESTCNCLTKSKTQTRYCHIRIRVTASVSPEVPSIHCLGSSGRFEENRTSSCKPGKDECKPIQRKQKIKPTEKSTIAALVQTSSVTSASGDWPTTSNESVFTNATTKIILTGGVAQVVTPSLESGHYVAIGVGGVLVVLLLILVLLLHIRRAKLLEKDNRRNSATNSQHTEEMTERSHNDEPCYARNDLYQDSGSEREMHSSLGIAGEPRPSISQNNTTTPNWVENDEDIYWSIVT